MGSHALADRRLEGRLPLLEVRIVVLLCKADATNDRVADSADQSCSCAFGDLHRSVAKGSAYRVLVVSALLRMVLLVCYQRDPICTSPGPSHDLARQPCERCCLLKLALLPAVRARYGIHGGGRGSSTR